MRINRMLVKSSALIIVKDKDYDSLFIVCLYIDKCTKDDCGSIRRGIA